MEFSFVEKCESTTTGAGAELEYKDISSPSIFVNFPVAKESIPKLIELGLVSENENAQNLLYDLDDYTLDFLGLSAFYEHLALIG